MQEEIFGPVLPIRTYTALDETINEINARPRPLALYYFGDDSAESEALLNAHAFRRRDHQRRDLPLRMDDLPFGGVGPSGMGAYHGHRGFMEFSHEKAIYRQISERAARDAAPALRRDVQKQMAARLKP